MFLCLLPGKSYLASSKHSRGPSWLSVGVTQELDSDSHTQKKVSVHFYMKCNLKRASICEPLMVKKRKLNVSILESHKIFCHDWKRNQLKGFFTLWVCLNLYIIIFTFTLKNKTQQVLKSWSKIRLFLSIKTSIKRHFNYMSTHHHSVCPNLKCLLHNETLEILILWHLESFCTCIFLLKTTCKKV